MPSGVPVACMAINGAKNAALLAIQILALKYNDLAEKIENYKAKLEY
jgi:5-(carboxyamino)imidazole ribonucleotide mutase